MLLRREDGCRERLKGEWMKTEAMIDADAKNPGNGRC
jgi:hypothetical protein